jgi:hypothetical protein
MPIYVPAVDDIGSTRVRLAFRVRYDSTWRGITVVEGGEFLMFSLLSQDESGRVR